MPVQTTIFRYANAFQVPEGERMDGLTGQPFLRMANFSVDIKTSILTSNSRYAASFSRAIPDDVITSKAVRWTARAAVPLDIYDNIGGFVALFERNLYVHAFNYVNDNSVGLPTVRVRTVETIGGIISRAEFRELPLSGYGQHIPCMITGGAFADASGCLMEMFSAGSAPSIRIADINKAEEDRANVESIPSLFGKRRIVLR